MLFIKSLILLLCNLMFVVSCYGQQQSKAITIFDELTSYYTNTSNYAIDFSYEMYKVEQEQEKLTEQYKVSLYKNKNRYQLNALNAKMYTYDDYVLSLFEDEKKIVVRNNSEGTSVDGLNQLSSFKKNYLISIDTETAKELVLKLVPKPEKREKTNYSLIKIIVDKKSNRIYKQLLTFKQLMPFPTETGAVQNSKATLKIMFMHKKIDKDFKIPEASYFIYEDNKRQLIPSSRYIDYSITDRRIKSAKK